MVQQKQGSRRNRFEKEIRVKEKLYSKKDSVRYTKFYIKFLISLIWYVNCQYLFGILKLTKNIFKTFTNTMMTIYPSYKLILKFTFSIILQKKKRWKVLFIFFF